MASIAPIELYKLDITNVSPKGMVYTSTNYHGLGILHPWYLQQLKHLQILIGESANKKIGKILL